MEPEVPTLQLQEPTTPDVTSPDTSPPPVRCPSPETASESSPFPSPTLSLSYTPVRSPKSTGESSSRRSSFVLGNAESSLSNIVLPFEHVHEKRKKRRKVFRYILMGVVGVANLFLLLIAQKDDIWVSGEYVYIRSATLCCGNWIWGVENV